MCASYCWSASHVALLLCAGDALQEMICINKSLTALGNVVHALYTAQRHTPYRCPVHLCRPSPLLVSGRGCAPQRGLEDGPPFSTPKRGMGHS